ncbi:hypothetical protein ACFWNC_30235 [Streptomyces sp. NPDC058369]|uniref:hypothetical protein n=1 Tax=Streptomyces sp. NPDC058369 TaxID=3346462 RepID=UPI0036486AAF
MAEPECGGFGWGYNGGGTIAAVLADALDLGDPDKCGIGYASHPENPMLADLREDFCDDVLSQFYDRWRLRRGAVPVWTRAWYLQQGIDELPAVLRELPPLQSRADDGLAEDRAAEQLRVGPHGRRLGEAGAPAPVAAPNSREWRVAPATANWWHQPPVVPAGLQELRVGAPDGYDFARLVWQVCDPCRPGLVAKIRVTGPWHHHGYGTRLMRLVLDGRGEYSWSTTPQSEDGRAFFPVVAAAMNVALPGQSVLCEHMHVKEPRFFRAGPAVRFPSPLTPSPKTHFSPLLDPLGSARG